MNAEVSGPSSPKAMMMDSSSSVRSPKRFRMQSSGSGSIMGGSDADQNSSTSSRSVSSNSLFKPLNSSALREQIVGELRKLKFARRNLGNKNKSDTVGEEASSTSFGSKSPQNHSDSSMGSFSPGRDDLTFDPSGNDSIPSSSSTLSAYNQFMLRRRRTNEFNNGGSTSSSNVAGSSNNNNSENDSANRPMFSFNQVVMIIERLVKEKEDDLRQEYDKVLFNRLAEQYEQFVKFTYDQIQRNFDSHSTPSYLS